MSKKMTIRGIGHMFEYYVIPLGLILLIISFIFKPLFSYKVIPYFILIIMGIVFLLIGLAINFFSMRKIIPAFKEGKLMTSGIFQISRNPAYASVILFTIPSLSFFFDTYLIILCSILAFILFKLLIKKEEVFLEEKFGEEYRIYKNTVGQLFPKIIKK